MLEGGKSVNTYGADSHPRAGRQVGLPAVFRLKKNPFPLARKGAVVTGFLQLNSIRGYGV